MSYTVLARRYRSTTFQEVVGQDAIAQTLQNAIDAGRTAHAYLFSGTRGIGKTSMARIFAKELNLNNELKEKETIGDAILHGSDLDVIEIDGASNRGVQEARDLIASAGLAPARCQYRIYIIDEVHMLTTPAFNALLKTMEEPPSHVKFILCTTEPHKVPATIQSRCQLFHFKSIPTASIANHLDFILSNENVSAEKGVTMEIARLGNGSMRDSLSILDRLLSYGNQSITKDDMQQILGLPQDQIVNLLCRSLAEHSLKASFEAVDELVNSGISLDQSLNIIASQLRNALIYRACGNDSPILDLNEESISRSAILSSTFDEATLTYMIALCDATGKQVRNNGSGRALFDATIARLCMTQESFQVSESTTYTPKKKIKLTASNNPVTHQQKSTQITNSETQELTWDLIQHKIANTAGIKSIASHLCFHTLEGHRLTLKIQDSGRDAIQLILSMRERVENAISDLASKKVDLRIITDPLPSQLQEGDPSLDEIEKDELVKTGRDLFEGTVVQVKENQDGRV